MNIGIIGAGNIGAALAHLFAKAGNEISISNSRGPDSLRDLVTSLEHRGHAMSVEQAAVWAEIVILAVPWRSPEALPKPESVAGKVVIDAMNPYGADGALFDLGSSTSSEETAKRLPGARIVKAFNTIYFKHLAENSRTDLPAEERDAIFIAGDDQNAKATVVKLIEQIGFAAVDTGSLHQGGRRQQPGSAIYNRPMKAGEAKKMLLRADSAAN